MRERYESPYAKYESGFRWKKVPRAIAKFLWGLVWLALRFVVTAAVIAFLARLVALVVVVGEPASYHAFFIATSVILGAIWVLAFVAIMAKER
jgi:hypothetical protein